MCAFAFSLRLSIPWLVKISSQRTILNSVNLNFVAFGKFIDVNINGQIIAIFIIILAAAEAAVALAIILNIYRNKTTIDVTSVDAMKN